MSKIIEKTVVSKYAPHDTNVDWLDVSGDKPVKKSYINGKWQVISGGGSGAGSSNPTEADATKVWQVTPVQKGVETKIETFEIFPEKSFLMSSTVIDAQNVDKFNVGNTAVVTINGVTYTSEIQDNDGASQVVIVTNSDDEATISNTFYITRRGSAIDFDFNNRIPPQPTVASLLVEDRQETPIYDYNWAPGVKIPIPTAEDEGKILVVTKVEGDNTSTIVPEQEVPADNQTPLTDVDLKYFVLGNTVTATVTITEQDAQGEPEGGEIIAKGPKSSNSETMIVSGIIEQEEAPFGIINKVIFNEGQEDEFSIYKVPYIEPEDPKSINTKSSSDTEYILVTNLCDLFGGDIPGGSVVKGNSGLRGNTIPYATIKLEYSESNYEYQLQENSGGGNSGGGGGGSVASKGVYGTLVNVYELPCFKPMSEWPLPDDLLNPTSTKLSDVLADGYRLMHTFFDDSTQEEYVFYIVKVTGENPVVSTDNQGFPVFTDCEPVPLGVPPFAPDYIVLRTPTLNFYADGTADIVGAETLEGKDLPHYYDSMSDTPLVFTVLFSSDHMAEPRIALGTHIIVAKQHQ